MSNVRIVVENRQTQYRLSRLRIRRLAAWLMGQVPPTQTPANLRWHELGVLLTDDAGMVAANRAVFERAAVTDVISLTYPSLPGERGGTGELLINVALAVRAGARRAGGPDRELALYLAHGCNHLGGANDATPRARAAMRRRELGWLRQAAARGLLAGLFSKRWGNILSPSCKSC